MSINDHFTIGETSDLLGITEREVVKYFGIEKRDGRVQREISIPEIERYCDTTEKQLDIIKQSFVKDKTGVEIKGVRAVNPANGKIIPIFLPFMLSRTENFGLFNFSEISVFATGIIVRWISIFQCPYPQSQFVSCCFFYNTEHIQLRPFWTWNARLRFLSIRS